MEIGEDIFIQKDTSEYVKMDTDESENEVYNEENDDDELKKTSEMLELLKKKNWKNKAKSPKKRKSLYLVDHPEIKFKFRVNSHSIDNVRNGNFLNPTSI